jgi:hypothetical protein
MSNDVVIEKNKYIAKVQTDLFPADPFDDGVLLSRVVTTKNKHFSHQDEEVGDISVFEEWCEQNDDVLAMPFYAYVHSGIVLSLHPFSDPWDSGQIGFIFIKEKDLQEIADTLDGKTLMEKAEDLFTQDIELLNNYLRGDVWRFSIIDKNTNELCFSCGDFYSHKDAVREAELSLAEHVRDAVNKEQPYLPGLENCA